MSVKGGGGVPPKSVTFFLAKILSVKGGGGTPLTDKIRKVVFDPFPYHAETLFHKRPWTHFSFFEVPPDEVPGTSNKKDERVVVVSQSTERLNTRPELQSKDKQLYTKNGDCLQRPGREEHEVSTNDFSYIED